MNRPAEPENSAGSAATTIRELNAPRSSLTRSGRFGTAQEQRWVRGLPRVSPTRLVPLGLWSAAMLIFAVALLMSPAFAQQFTPYSEIWRKSQVFEPRPSLDITPVTVRVVSVVYRIPRNYLTHLEPAIPTLKLTWPGLKPLTEETRKCFGSILQSEQAGCTSIDFRLMGSGGNDPRWRALTSRRRFENSIRGLEHLAPRHSPFGYVIYEMGPAEARTEFYWRDEGQIYFRCSVSEEEERRLRGVCNDLFRLDDGNHIQFFFRRSLIEQIPEIEAGMRRLMASFVVGVINDNDGVEPGDAKRDQPGPDGRTGSEQPELRRGLHRDQQ
jgi:hypothetical protein